MSIEELLTRIKESVKYEVIVGEACNSRYGSKMVPTINVKNEWNDSISLLHDGTLWWVFMNVNWSEEEKLEAFINYINAYEKDNK